MDQSQVQTGQLIDRETRLNLHKQRGAFIPDPFIDRVAGTEELRDIYIAIKIEPVLLGKGFILQIYIIVTERPKAGMVAPHHVNALVPPVGKILAIIVRRRCRDAGGETGQQSARS